MSGLQIRQGQIHRIRTLTGFTPSRIRIHPPTITTATFFQWHTAETTSTSLNTRTTHALAIITA